MSEKVYGIWYADYSNSYVGSGVYTNRDDACAVARAGDEADVVEFEVDPPLSEGEKKMRRPGESFYFVGMDIDGNESKTREEFRDTTDERTSVRVHDGKVGRFNTHTWASDEKHALKIANDRRTQWIANGSRYSPSLNDYGWADALFR